MKKVGISSLFQSALAEEKWGRKGANDEKETACKDFGLFPPFEFFSSSGLTLGRIKSQQQKGEDA